MDSDTTEFPMTAAVQPGNSGGPVLVWRRQPARRDGGAHERRRGAVGHRLGAAERQFRHQGRCRGKLSAGERRRAEDQRRHRAAPPAADRGGGKAFTAQVMCVRAGGWGGVD